tara:strand:- start:323 stop:790 length:468 start_codon:yes stop_codon:yes gene_type:complete
MDTMENDYRNGIGALLAGLSAIAICVSSISDNMSNYSEPRELGKEEIAERNRDSVKDDINKIAVYQLFNGSPMDYQSFLEVTGIEGDLSSDFDGSPLWINVSAHEGIKYSAEDDGRVRIDIPQRKARSVLSKLNRYRDDYLGIKPLEKGVVGGFP